ncbi:MAG: hypothetical protein CFE26_07125 [Verrucomicrobiales bacterium VVV1]|nr:MAG: hypothetical protein CFE26_07125 [Verrucomicrobiales bacterium VVV1]
MFLLYAAWCSVAGWTLSAIGFLRPLGYLIALLPLVGGLALILKWYRHSLPAIEYKYRRRRRFRTREWMFALILAIVLVGAVTNEPFGWDACAYRLPRVQQWLSEGRWTWLNSGDDRMDISAVSFEWMIAPQLALLKTDRLLFVNNFLPYALMPGLCWLASRAIGLRRDWSLFLSSVLPLGFCFVLQAGGLQNDGVAAFFALVSVVLARSTSAKWLPPTWRLGLCFVALALLSGLKLTNVPLAGVLGIWIVWREFKPLQMLGWNFRWLSFVATVSIACSILPIALANQIYAGNWSGDPTNRYQHKAQNPLAAVVANGIFLLTDAMTPNPVSGNLNRWLDRQRSNPESFISKLTIEHVHLSYLRFPFSGYEGTSGPGPPLLIGVPLVLALSICMGRRISSTTLRQDIGFLALVGGAYLVFLASIAVHESQRHAAAYYPLLAIGGCGYLGSRFQLRQSMLTGIILLGSGLTVITTLFLSPVRIIIPRTFSDALDRKGGSFRMHREAAQEGAVLAPFEGRRIYYVLSWGAVGHRLREPHHFGEMIEIGSALAARRPPAGKGLVYVSETGIHKRFGMTVEEFLLTIGPHKELARDLVSADVGRGSDTGTLYEVDDLSRIPVTDRRRLYPNE